MSRCSPSEHVNILQVINFPVGHFSNRNDSPNDSLNLGKHACFDFKMCSPERNRPEELARAIQILINYGNYKHMEMEQEENPYKRKSLPKGIVPFFKRAVELAGKKFDVSGLNKRIADLEEIQNDVS